MLEQMIIAVAVFLTLSYAELTECYISVQAELKTVHTNETAFLSCPALVEHEKSWITLHKGDTLLHRINLSDVDSKQSRFQVFVQNSSVSFKIQRTESNDTGLYICKINTENRSPNYMTILIIADPQQPTEITVTCSFNIPVLPVGCGLVIYDVLITFIVCYYRRKWRTAEQPENPYINTRPLGHQRRR